MVRPTLMTSAGKGNPAHLWNAKNQLHQGLILACTPEGSRPVTGNENINSLLPSAPLLALCKVDSGLHLTHSPLMQLSHCTFSLGF